MDYKRHSFWLGHKNIIDYCDRPFSSVEEMNEKMIEEWNNLIEKDDKVWHLGDFAFGSKDNVKNIISRLNGKIYLVKGNHDKMSNQWYRDIGFKEVYDYPIIIDDFVVLSHEPQSFICDNRVPYVNFFGHIHDSLMYDTYGPRHFCACTERHEYKPVSLEAVYKHFDQGENENE